MPGLPSHLVQELNVGTVGFDIQCMVCGLGFSVALPLSVSFSDVLTVTNYI